MDLTIPGSSQKYLADLDRTQSQLTKAQAQISSGLRLQNVSDDPSAIAQIYHLQAAIATNKQTQANLAGATSEVSAADVALQSAVQTVESAISLAAQGANSTQTAQDRANLAQQVSGLLQALVSISQTRVNGRYIFSGDQDTQPAYHLDATQPNGVKQLLTAGSTLVISDSNGAPISIARTAQEIFDARDANGDSASSNIFAAVNSLLRGLQNNDQTAISNAASALNSANDYLNGQLAFYGDAETRLTAASDLAQKFLTGQQASLGQVQDADVPAAALALTQATTQLQAALSVEAKIQQQPNLFSYLA